MTVDAQAVWHGAELAGRLRRRRNGKMEFRYDRQWIYGGGYAISQSVPLDAADLTVFQERAHRFFANLLPEGAARERIVRISRVPDDDFALLGLLGGECAGALSILPDGQEPEAPGTRAYEPIDTGMLNCLVRGRGWDSRSTAVNPAARLSLAGAQDKMTVAVFDGLMHLPQGTAPSTHVLKFDPRAFTNVLAYECFATLIARSAALPVVQFELRETRNEFVGLVERYDRCRGACGRILKSHQEDFCQALGYSSRNKYEADAGPSFASCFRLVRAVSDDPPSDLENLLRWQIFNVLAGNSDGHAKNLALLYDSGGGTRLAPFYDLVPTRAIANLDHALALSVGGVSNPGNIRLNHWETLAKKCDIRPASVIALVEETAESLMANLGRTKEQFEDLHGHFPALQRVERVIRSQCLRAMRRN